MTKSKAQNKFKCQIAKFKTKVLSFGICALALFYHLCFGICHSVFAAELPRYEIECDLDTANHKIDGRQKVSFTNNSEKEFMLRYAGYFKIDPFPDGFQSGDLKIKNISDGSRNLSFSYLGDDQTIL